MQPVPASVQEFPEQHPWLRWPHGVGVGVGLGVGVFVGVSVGTTT